MYVFTIPYGCDFSRYQCKQTLRNSSSTKCEKPKSDKNDFASCTIPDCMVDPTKPEPSIVIIGAGIAGLSAAQRLVQCGINNFTVLEATDRLVLIRCAINTN